MDPNAGRIHDLTPDMYDEADRKGWIPIKVNETVDVKGCRFSVQSINSADGLITLKIVPRFQS